MYRKQTHASLKAIHISVLTYAPSVHHKKQWPWRVETEETEESSILVNFHFLHITNSRKLNEIKEMSVWL
jgi:hypothetical protein